MKLILLGTGAARPDAARSAPSQVVVINNKPILIDCGGGTAMRLMQAKISPPSIESILFTHLHADHCSEYPSIVHAMWLMNRKSALSVFGPRGTAKMHSVFFNELFTYAYPSIKKIKGIDMDVRIKEVGEGVVQEQGAAKISATQVIHGAIETLAYRFDANDKSIIISGDTAPAQSLVNLAKGADLLVHECSFPDERGETPDHTIPRQLGEIAAKAQVKKVVLSHLFPECSGKEETMVQSVRKSFGGEVVAGKDLMEFEL